MRIIIIWNICYYDLYKVTINCNFFLDIDALERIVSILNFTLTEIFDDFDLIVHM